MKKRLLSIAILSSLTLLTACGGGGSGTPAATTSTTPAAAQATYTVTGTVPGTLIEGFCDNGSYYKTNSTQNNTTKHPFSLNIASGHVCNLTMTMDETTTTPVTTAIGFTDSNGFVSTNINGIAGTTVALGDIQLHDKQSSAGFDSDDDGVIDAPYDTTISSSTGFTVETRNTSSTTSTLDSDGDGIPNAHDSDYVVATGVTDSDNDGLPDSDDVNPQNNTTASNSFDSSRDANGDGYLDTDSNHDGFNDNDSNHDGKIDNDETGS